MVNFGKMKGDYGGMGMLKSISLENYKCFENLKPLEVKPLTILCGVNSSGKSSILKSLLMMKQSFESDYNKNSVIFNGEFTSNGSYRDIVFKHKIANPIKINNVFSITNDILISEPESVALSTLTRLSHLISISNINIEINLELVQNTTPSYSYDNIVKHYLINFDFEGNRLDKLSEAKKYGGFIELDLVDNDKYNVHTYFPFLSPKESNVKNCKCYFSGLFLNGVTYEVAKYEIDQQWEQSIISIFRLVRAQYKGIKFLAPLQSTPKRFYSLLEYHDYVGQNGEFVPQILYKHQNTPISHLLPPPDDNVNFKTDRLELIDFVNGWGNYLDIDPIILPKNESNQKDVISLQIGESNYEDVGFGISQILPILTSGLMLNKNEIMILQQPETHLHPRMQMKLADFLLSCAYANKEMIVETHSDHILHRIVLRILQDKTGKLNKMVRICFVDKSNINNQITEINIDPQQGITNAPEEFFTQFGTESIKIAKTAIKNHREGIVW